MSFCPADGGLDNVPHDRTERTPSREIYSNPTPTPDDGQQARISPFRSQGRLLRLGEQEEALLHLEELRRKSGYSHKFEHKEKRQ